MNKYDPPPPVANLPVKPFGSQSPLKSQHFNFFGQKLTDVPIWSTILSSNLITIIVAERWFLQHVRVCNHCWCSVCVHSTFEVKGL